MLSDKLSQLPVNTKFCIIAEYPDKKLQSEYFDKEQEAVEFLESNEGATRLLLQYPESGKYRMVI